MRIWGFKEYIAVKAGKSKYKSCRKVLSGILIVLYFLLICLIPFVMMYLGSELKAGTAGVIGAGLVMIAALYYLWLMLIRVNMSKFDVFIKDDNGLFRVRLGSSNSLKLKNPNLVDNQLHIINSQFEKARESGEDIDITKTKDVSIVKIIGVKDIIKRRRSYMVNCTIINKGGRRKKILRIKRLEGVEYLISELELVRKGDGYTGCTAPPPR